jgi:hypothetical protein
MPLPALSADEYFLDRGFPYRADYVASFASAVASAGTGQRAVVVSIGFGKDTLSYYGFYSRGKVNDVVKAAKRIRKYKVVHVTVLRPGRDN